jgi:hypothetical protein
MDPIMLQRPRTRIRRWTVAQLNTLMVNNPAAARQIIDVNRFVWQSILPRDMITD